VELRDLEAYGEPGAIVYRVDCVEPMRLMPAGSVDAIFADPPYRLSSGGLTVKSGSLAPVDKREWDRSRGASVRTTAHIHAATQHVVGRHRRCQSESAH
jgi:site-specific DNA-methyltransferase (adenine-specific)